MKDNKVINAKPMFKVKSLLNKNKKAFSNIVIRLVNTGEVTPKEIKAKYKDNPRKRDIALSASKFCDIYNQLDYWYSRYEKHTDDVKAKNQMALWATEMELNGSRYLSNYLAE